jgi:hypothetical protein
MMVVPRNWWFLCLQIRDQKLQASFSSSRFLPARQSVRMHKAQYDRLKEKLAFV